MENAALEHVTQTCDKNKAVNILSLGCGKLLQEWIFIGRLIQKGYIKFNLRLIDLHLDKERFETFRAFFSQLPGIQITIAGWRFNQSSYKNPYDLIMAFDFDEAHESHYQMPDGQKRYGWDDALEMHKHLKEHGKLFFGSGPYDWEIAKDGSFKALHMDKHLEQTLQDLDQKGKVSKKELHLFAEGSLTPQLTFVVKKLLEMGVEKIFIDQYQEHDKYNGMPTRVRKSILKQFAAKDRAKLSICFYDTLEELSSAWRWRNLLDQPFLPKSLRKAYRIDLAFLSNTETASKLDRTFLDDKGTAYFFDVDKVHVYDKENLK
jgi:hypothetical protein